MEIRRAEERDMPVIHELLTQVNRVHHEGRPDLFNLGTKYTDEELRALIHNDQKPIFVYDDGGVRGYAFCVFQQYLENNMMTDIKTLYIDDLCVDETWRGHHVGKSLYEYVLKFAKEQGCYNVTLNVWTCNEKAMGFYKACGLTPGKIGMENII